MSDNRRYSAKKPNRVGSEQFIIQVIKGDKEVKKFTVYKEDSSEDSAKKLVKNLKFDDNMIPYFAKYIDERRIMIDDENNYMNYSRHPYGAGNIEGLSQTKSQYMQQSPKKGGTSLYNKNNNAGKSSKYKNGNNPKYNKKEEIKDK